MFRRVHDYEQLTVHATNVELGSIDDFLFDDGRWTVRYLVVGTGSLFGRRVAVSPIAVAEPDWNAHRLVLRLSRDRIREGPDPICVVRTYKRPTGRLDMSTIS